MVFSLDHHHGSEENQAGWDHHDPSLVDKGRAASTPCRSGERRSSMPKLESSVVGVVGDSATVGSHWRCQSLLLHRRWPRRRTCLGRLPRLGAEGGRGGWLAIHDVFADPADGGRPPYEHLVGGPRIGPVRRGRRARFAPLAATDPLTEHREHDRMQLVPRYDGPAVVDLDDVVGDPSGPFIRQRSRLADLLVELGSDEWTAPSRCEGWSVQDVIAHLVGVNRYWIFSIGEGLKGRPTRLLASFDPVTVPAAMVERARGTPPSETLDGFRSTNDELAAMLNPLGDADWSALAEAPPGHVAIRVVVAHALWDSWIHERDVVLPLSRATSRSGRGGPGAGLRGRARPGLPSLRGPERTDRRPRRGRPPTRPRAQRGDRRAGPGAVWSRLTVPTRRSRAERSISSRD